MKLTVVTEQEILSSDRKNYNEAEWKKKVNRFSNQKDVVFYKADELKYGGEVFYALYQINEGIRIFTEVSYISSLSTTRFRNIQINLDGALVLGSHKFQNNPEGRKEMAKLSMENGLIFTTEF